MKGYYTTIPISHPEPNITPTTNQKGGKNQESQSPNPNQTPPASSSDTREQSLQSHRDRVRRFEESLRQSDPTFTHRLFQLTSGRPLQCLRLPQSPQPLNIHRSQCKLPLAPQLPPPTAQECQTPMIHKKSSTNSTSVVETHIAEFEPEPGRMSRPNFSAS